jgi:hypothetical protein
MSEEIIKWKINVLYGVISKMRTADDKINKLNLSIQNLKKVFADNIKINDEVAYKECPENGLKKTKNASGQINGKIIPSLYYSIDKLKKQLDS